MYGRVRLNSSRANSCPETLYPRHRLIERLNVGLSTDNKPEGMPKESRFDKEIASRRALATLAPGASAGVTLPGYGNTACLLRQTHSYRSTYFQKIPQDRDNRTHEDTSKKKPEVMARSLDLAWMEFIQ